MLLCAGEHTLDLSPFWSKAARGKSQWLWLPLVAYPNNKPTPAGELQVRASRLLACLHVMFPSPFVFILCLSVFNGCGLLDEQMYCSRLTVVVLSTLQIEITCKDVEPELDFQETAFSDLLQVREKEIERGQQIGNTLMSLRANFPHLMRCMCSLHRL